MKAIFGNFALHLVAGLIALLATATGMDARAQSPQLLAGPGPAGVGAPACGGFVNGRWQPPCAGVPARFEGNVNYSCPAGSFFDSMGSCWSCPAGYKRTAEPVTSDRACDKADASVKGGYLRATFGGSLCPPGSFKDGIRGGECWSCPQGYQRSAASVEAPNACYIPASEQFSGAQRHSRGLVLPHELPARCNRSDGRLGFYDVWDGGGCWSCPSGFTRTGYAIWDTNGRQCVRHQGEAQSRATLVGKPACKPGEFEDGRNGGECWSCPTGTTRTVFPVHEAQACERWGGYVYAKATQTQANMLGCGTGLGSDKGEAFFDAVPSSNPNVLARIRAQNNGNLPAGVATSGVAGTCWSCPAGYKRSDSSDAVWTAGACRSTSMVWSSAKYNQPGLFRLDGGPEVALALVRERTAIDAIADALAPQLGLSSAEARRNIWNQIANDPQDSGALMMAAFARVIAAVSEPDKATEAERRLARSFAEAVRQFQIFIAQDAINAYQAWKATWDRREKERGDELTRTKSMAVVLNIPVGVPPDFEEIVFNNIMGSMAAAGSINAAATMTLAMSKTSFQAVGKVLFPYSYAGRAATMTQRLLTVGAQRAQTALVPLRWVSGSTPTQMTNVVGGARFVTQTTVEKATQATAQTAARAAASGANQLSKLFSIGPQIIITAAIEFITALIQDAVAREEALPKLQARLKAAEQPVDLARLLNTEQGTAKVLDDWANVMGSDAKPLQIAPYAEAARIALAAAAPAAAGARPAAAVAGTWHQLPGLAVDVGMGGGVLWHIGTNKVPGGFGIYRWDGKAWQGVSGGAVRIDVDGQGNPVVSNDKGEIYRWQGQGWTKLPGLATDVGVGANGSIWVIGTNPVGGGFGVYRWDGKDKWQTMPGGAVRIDVDPQGNAWVVTNSGQIWRWEGNRFVQLPGQARDIGIGPEGSVFVLGADNTVHKWNGSGWTRRDGLLTQVTVGPEGVPYGASADQKIWMGYR